MIANDRDAHSLRSSKSAARKQVKELNSKPPHRAARRAKLPRLRGGRPVGEDKSGPFQLSFNSSLKVAFQAARVNIHLTPSDLARSACSGRRLTVV